MRYFGLETEKTAMLGKNRYGTDRGLVTQKRVTWLHNGKTQQTQ